MRRIVFAALAGCLLAVGSCTVQQILQAFVNPACLAKYGLYFPAN